MNENPEVIPLAKLEPMRLREGLPGDMPLIVLNPLDATYHAFGFPLGMGIDCELLTEVTTRFVVLMRGVEAKKARRSIARATPLLRKAS